MKKLFLFSFLAFVLGCAVRGQNAPMTTAYLMSGGDYLENFADIANWSANFGSGIGAGYYNALPEATYPEPNQTTVFSSGSGGGVQKGTQNIVLLASGTADNVNAAAFDLWLDFTGRTAGTLSLDWAEVNNSSGDRSSTFKVQTNTGSGGAFVDLPGTTVVITNNVSSGGSLTTIALPSGFNGLCSAKIRFYLWNSGPGSSGSRPKISLDNVAVTSTPLLTPAIGVCPPTLSGFTYLVGTGPSASQSFTLGGINLAPAAGNITVTAPADYEVSLNNTTFSGSMLIPYLGGTLTSMPIFVRLKAGLAQNNYNNEMVTNAGGSATTMNVTCNGTVLPDPPLVHAWIGADMGDWTVASNWSPSRTIAFPNDVLHFNDGTTKTIVNLPSQSIGQMSVSNNTNVTLQSAVNVTLTIAGGTGDDLTVGAGSQLNLGGSSAITIALPAGATGTIDGSMTFSGSSSVAHRLTGIDIGSIVFTSGSIFTAGTNFSGNAFGNKSLNSVVFHSGATYIDAGGNNPFAASAPASVVSFQTGSLFKLSANLTPSFSGRTYANFELDFPAAFVTVTGTSAVVMDNLTITNGTLYFDMTGTPGHSIKGNITVAGGQTLMFSPLSAGTVKLNGSTLQTIGGSGTITGNANSTITINNGNGVILDNNFNQNGSLDISAGTLTVNPGKELTVGGTTTLGSPACLILKSNSSSTASFIDNGFAGTGTAKVERYLTTGIHHYISSPISDATANVFLGDYLRTSNPALTGGWGPWIVDPATSLQVMRGYDCWKPVSNPGLETFTGTLNTGDETFTGSRIATDPFEGWHMTGNPYPSAIDLSSGGINWDHFEATAYFWDQSGSGNPLYTSGNYDVYPTYGTFGTHSAYAPATQGFFVHINGTYTGSSTLTFTNATRVHSGESFLKNENLIQNALLIEALSSVNTYSDKISIHFDAAATTGYDPGYDAYKLQGLHEAPQLYSKIGETKVSCNTLPFTDKNMVIPMGFSCGLPGQYTLRADSLGTFQNNIGISLEDLKLNTTEDLRINREYTFTYDTLDTPDRFLLHFYNPSFGLDELKNENPVQIYSFGSSVYIRSTGGTFLTGDVFIYDIIGREIYRGQIDGNTLNRITPRINEGYYGVKVVLKNGVYSGKVYLGRE